VCVCACEVRCRYMFVIKFVLLNMCLIDVHLFSCMYVHLCAFVFVSICALCVLWLSLIMA